MPRISWRIVRWIAWPVGAVFGLVCLGFAALAWYVGTPGFRAQLIAAAEAQTGRDLTVNGRMHVAFWPIIGVSAENVTLANVEGGAAEHFLAAEEIDLGADLAALLRQDLIVRRIRVEEASLNLEVDAQGRGNWLLGPAQPAPAPRPDGPPAEQALRVDSLRIEGTRVSFTDRRTNQTYGLDDLRLATRLEGWDIPARVDAEFEYRSEPVTLEADVAIPGALRTGAETPLTFTADSRFLSASFEGAVAVATGVIQGQVTAAGPSVRDLSRWQGFAIPEGETLQRFNVSGALNASPQGLAFSNASMEVDAILARGDFTFQTVNSRPYLSGRLEIPRLDLNRYLMPSTAQTASADEPVAVPAALDMAQPAWADAPIDLAALRTLDLNLELTTGPISLFRTTLDRAVLTMVANQGFVAATLHEGQLYGGAVTGRVEIDARQAGLRLANDLALDGIAVERLLADTFGVNLLGGVGQVRLALSAQGQTQAQLVGSLAGRAALVLNQGTLRGLDLGGMSETIQRVVRGEIADPNAVTQFSALSLSFDLNAGRAATTDFFVTIPGGLRIGAVGVFDLVQRRVDLRFMPRGRLITTPFVMRGPFTGPLTFESDLRGRFREEFDGLVGGVRGGR
jgi:AsmA protein